MGGVVVVGGRVVGEELLEAAVFRVDRPDNSDFIFLRGGARRGAPRGFPLFGVALGPRGGLPPSWGPDTVSSRGC